MFHRKNLMLALAAKNDSANKLDKEKKGLEQLQKQLTKLSEEKEKLTKATEVNNKKSGLYLARIKSQYEKLESKEQEPAEGFMEWASDSPFVNIKKYHKEITQLEKENKQYKVGIRHLEFSIAYVSQQIVSKKQHLTDLKDVLKLRNKKLEKCLPEISTTYARRKYDDVENSTTAPSKEHAAEKENKSNLRKG